MGPTMSDPGSARNTAEFAEMMRRLKLRSGLTYRDLEREAARRGDYLARSTLASVIANDRLPRPDLLCAFVRACGCDDEVGRWLSARHRIVELSARQGSPATASHTPTEVPPTWVLLCAALALVLAMRLRFTRVPAGPGTPPVRRPG
ncbi:hypothetical protein [Actinokineospora globicatena]|uniref:Helix-turn-helix domain-containing protein n=1 Tax=Actinokineospora globicatena TaxID=103729 RepID=A0A9W6QHQ7_9PSEU|nr:hypothetical protein [Actinokineospora globicatena]GLW89637.1 hypothetical protein Aglo03_04530 [Actinokineospora globicatena]